MDTKTALNIAVALLVWLSLVVLAGWVISTALGYAIRWLRKQKQVQRLAEVVKQGGQSWWSRHEAESKNLFEFLWEMLIDPLFFAFVVFVLFNRITSIEDYVAAHPGTNFWSQFNLDMERNVNFYMLFLVIFTVWMMGKAWTHRRQETEQRTIRKALEANTKVLEAIAQQMGVPESKYKTTDTKPDAKPDTELDQYKDF